MKDGIDDYVVQGEQEAVNPEQRGTKAAAHYVLTIEAGRDRRPAATLDRRRRPADGVRRGFRPDLSQTACDEADEFYATVTPRGSLDRRRAA